jgi:hypothetical protein
MSEDIDVKPGMRITVVRDGLEFQDTVHSVRYRSAQPEILRRPTGLRLVVRRLTPQRWRKPLPVLRPYQPASTEVICVGEVDRRALRMAEDVESTIHRLLDGFA